MDNVDATLMDAERLEHFTQVLAGALDAIAGDIYPLCSAGACWQPAYLVDVLQDHLRLIGAERARVAQVLAVGG